MASFTDPIPQFKEYVPQLPVEAMVKAGLYKQQRYEENVQKIQSQIDNIAGLDVLRDVDKNYLQSKLNDLGNRLTAVAAGDFSNFQLVNSVSGMTSQIIKDKNVQNAVASTQVVRKGNSDMEAARKSGKSSPENEWWWRSQVSSWMNDPNLGTPFSGNFIEYRDVDKKLRDIADKIHEVDNSVDIPYRRDGAGNVLYFDKNGNVSTDPSKGSPIVDDAMLRIKTKGKPAEKLLNNFYDSLDENDKSQLMITGNYHYRNATKETFKNDITNTYREKEKMLSDYIVNLSVKLKTDTGLSDVEKKELEATLTRLNNRLKNGDLKKEEDQRLKEIDNISNLDDYKYRLYTEKYLTNLAKDISYQSVQQEILSNPYAQMDMEKKKLQFQVNRARQEHEEWQETHKLALAKYNLDATKEERERLKNQPIVVPGAARTDVTKPSLSGLEVDMKGIEQKIAEVNSQYGNILFPKLSGTEKQKALDELVSKYNQNPKSITDNAQREYIEQVRGWQVELLQKGNLFKSIQSGSKVFDDQIDKAIQGKPGVAFRDGTQMYSAKEIFSVIQSLNRNTSAPLTFAGGTAGATAGVGNININGILAEHKGKRTEALAIAIVKNATGQQLTPTERVLRDRLFNLKNETSPIINKIVEDKYKWQSEELAKRMPEYQTMQGTLSKDNKSDMDRVQQLITQKINEFNTYGAVDVYSKKDFSPDTISELLKKTDVGYTINKNYDGSATLTITSGSSKQIVPMTSSEFSAYFPSYSTVNPVTNIKYAVLASPNKTTNLTGTADPVNAYLSGFNLPGIMRTPLAPKVRVDVEGSANNNGGPNDKFQVRLYYNTNNGWKDVILNNQGYIGEDAVQTILDNIGPATIESMLKQ